MKNCFFSRLLVLRAEARKCLQGWKAFSTRRPGGLLYSGLRVASRDFSFECDGCGCAFVPAPDSFILTNPVRVVSHEAGNEMCLVGPEEPLTRTKLEGLSEFELGELGLTEGDRKTLLAGNPVFTSAEAFCPACLQQIFS
jgi:hypothetical protein